MQPESFVFVALIAVCYALDFGISRIYGIFFLHLQYTFESSAAEISAILSVSVTVRMVGGPFYGAFYKITGLRKSLIVSASLLCLCHIASSCVQSTAGLTLFFGIIRGIGGGINFLVLFEIIGQTFNKARPLVNNVLTSTAALLATGISPVIQIGLDNYGWRGVLLILGGVFLNIIPMAWIISNLFTNLVLEKRNSEQSNCTVQSASNSNKISNCDILIQSICTIFEASLLKDPLFVAFCFSAAFTDAARFIPVIYLVRYAQNIGISNQDSSMLLMVYFAIFFSWCLLMGFFITVLNKKKSSSQINGNKTLEASSVVIAVGFLECLVCFLPILNDDYISYLVYTILMGICEGSFGALPITLVVDFFGTDKLAGAMGFRSMLLGLVMLVASAFTGLLVDILESYKPVQFVTASSAFLGSASLFIINRQLNSRNRRYSLQRKRRNEVVIP